jgi:hypothetical protein
MSATGRQTSSDVDRNTKAVNRVGLAAITWRSSRAKVKENGKPNANPLRSQTSDDEVATPGRFELPTFSLEGCCSIHLSYGAVGENNKHVSALRRNP